MVFVASRAEDARRTADQPRLQHWRDVAHSLLTLAEESGPEGDPGRLWAWIRRIEFYRHRAQDLERKAVSGTEALRDERIELAAQWRDLALQAQLLVERQQR